MVFEGETKLLQSLVITIDLVSIDSRGRAPFEAFGLSKETCGQTMGIVICPELLRPICTYIEHESHLLCHT